MPSLESLDDIDFTKDLEPDEGAADFGTGSERSIRKAIDQDELESVIKIVNMMVDLKCAKTEGIPITTFMALRRMRLAELFLAKPEKVYAQNKAILKGRPEDIRKTDAYNVVCAKIEEALEYVYSVKGVNDAASKFEPQIARAMIASATTKGRDGNKLLMDLGDRAAPKPQRQSNNQVVYVLPGTDLEAFQRSREMGSAGLEEHPEISATVLNVPKLDK